MVAEVETDKATMEVEAAEDGVIGKLLLAEGTEHVPVNHPIAACSRTDDDMRRSRRQQPAERTRGGVTAATQPSPPRIGERGLSAPSKC